MLSICLDFDDLWIGYYRGENWHYVCLLPTVVIRWIRLPAIGSALVSTPDPPQAMCDLCGVWFDVDPLHPGYAEVHRCVQYSEAEIAMMDAHANEPRDAE